MSAEERIAKAKAMVESEITENKIVVYAKTWCPHCKATKELLATPEFEGVKILIKDIDTITEPPGPVLARALKDLTGQTSVPNIFIDGKHFGGNSDLQEAHKSGSLNLA